jgi:hypothetical protein
MSPKVDISIITCNYRKSRIPSFKKNILSYIGDVVHEIIIVDNSKNNYSIFEAYNIGIGRSNGEFLLFLHDDIEFRTNKFGEILLSLNLPNLGVLGIAGSKIKTTVTSPWWISNHEKVPNGILFQSNIQHYSNTKPQFRNIGFTYENQIEEVELVDGVLLFTTRQNCKLNPFDEKYCSFHFYDLDYCLGMKKNGKINYVTNAILLEHYSAGSLNKDWVESSFLFENKWNKPFIVKEFTKNQFELLAYESRVQTLLQNKFYLKTFEFIFRYKFISTKIFRLILKTIFRG